MNIRCVLTCTDGTGFTLTDCLRFSLLRERYLPYAELHIEMPVDDPDTPVPAAVQLYLGNQLLHHGMVQKASVLRAQNGYVLRADSKSYTAALIRNQIVPGMYYNVTLESLIQSYNLPYITCDTQAETVNYVLIREHVGIWDAVVAYCYKYNKGYPYVRVPNLICAEPQDGLNPTALPADAVLQCGCAEEPALLISRVDMADLDGVYGSFSQTNPEAERRGIVNVKQIPFDRQYLYSPRDALQFRIACSARRLRQKTVSYAGYCGEDLEDAMRLPDGSTAHVSRILLTGDGTGLTAKDTFYFDDFCNLPES